MPSAWRLIFAILTAMALAGCNTPIYKGKSPLAPPQMSPDSVVLDLFFVRVPFGNPDANERIWKEIDEQSFSPELRERLSRNGFRAGVVNGQIPGDLTKLLELEDKPAVNGKIEDTKVDNLESAPRVVRRHLQLRAGQRSEIQASNVYAQVPLSMCESGQLCGQTYYQAQGILAIKAFSQPDGQVRMELMPELHHGDARPRWIGGPGMMRLDSSRPKQVFDKMALSAEIAPGSMIVLSSLANRPGSLGHYFFTQDDGSGHLEQKLLIVRLSSTQHDGLFNPPEPIKLEE
jgi:hypothetical protein